MVASRVLALCAHHGLTAFDDDSAFQSAEEAREFARLTVVRNLAHARRDLAIARLRARNGNGGASFKAAFRAQAEMVECLEHFEDEIARTEDEIACVEIVDIDPGTYPPMYGEGEAFTVKGEEWAVLTDDEADRAQETALDSYLEDCVEGAGSPYFDEKAWKRDRAAFDGRGHILSGGGCEYEEQIRGEWFYLYRVN